MRGNWPYMDPMWQEVPWKVQWNPRQQGAKRDKYLEIKH